MTERRGHRSGSHRIAVGLGPDARALIDAARNGDDPSAGDRRRVRRALFAAVAGTAIAGGATATASAAGTAAAASGSAAGGTTAAAGTAAAGSTVAATSAATAGTAVAGGAIAGGTIATGASTVAGAGVGASLVAKVAALVIAVGAAGGAIAVTTQELAEPEPEQLTVAVYAEEASAPRAELGPAPSTIGPVAPSAPVAPIEVAIAAEAPVEIAAPVPQAPVITPRTARVARSLPDIAPPLAEPAPSAPVELAGLADEMPLLRRASSAIRAGDVDGALAALAEHEARFPSGALAPEREANRAIALCTGDRAGGSAAAEAFLASHPRSPLASRVRAACAD